MAPPVHEVADVDEALSWTGPELAQAEMRSVDGVELPVPRH